MISQYIYKSLGENKQVKKNICCLNLSLSNIRWVTTPFHTFMNHLSNNNFALVKAKLLQLQPSSTELKSPRS